MIKLGFHTSLAKIFPDEICSGGITGGKLYTLKNQRSSFQVSLISDTDVQCSISINSDIAEYISYFEVKNIPSTLTKVPSADDYILRNGAAGEYPDALMPISNSITLKSGQYKALWFEFDIPSDCSAGSHYVTITATANGVSVSGRFVLQIFDAVYAEQKLKCTDWFHTDCLANYYEIEVFSDEYWKIVKNYILTAKKHGINMILTPLFTPPLDTEVGKERPTVQLVDVKREYGKYYFEFDRLERWINLCNECGIRYFEMSHLFTQWGAEHAPKIMAQTENGYERIFGWETNATGNDYADFIKQFAAALKVFIEKHDIGQRCYFHISDEPNNSQLLSYGKASMLINDVLGEYKHIDACSSYTIYKNGYIEIPVPKENFIENFIAEVPELWTYYCLTPGDNNMPNRYFCHPSLRNRIIGVIMYVYGVEGFLHWGYNFWYTKLSKAEINPYQVSDAGGEFPSGDAYVVYPGDDGTPVCSLRLKVFYDAIQDFTALQMLEEYLDKSTVLALVEKHLGKISFSEYSKDEDDLLALMSEVYSLIEVIGFIIKSKKYEKVK